MGRSNTDGPLNGLSVTNGYDNFLRRTNLSALAGRSPLIQQSYGYDAASRLQTVSDGNGNVAGYSYLANSPLVGPREIKPCDLRCSPQGCQSSR
jgi:hypothetical protein